MDVISNTMPQVQEQEELEYEDLGFSLRQRQQNQHIKYISKGRLSLNLQAVTN